MDFRCTVTRIVMRWDVIKLVSLCYCKCHGLQKLLYLLMFVSLVFLIYLCTYLVLINFLCQNWNAWAVGTVNKLKFYHLLQAYHSVQKSYLKVLKIRLYRTTGWLKSCATQYVSANFTICGNPMQLLQNQIYGNTVYFQI